jgi:hypothetical protein
MVPAEVESRQEEDDLLREGVAVPVPRILIFTDQPLFFPLSPEMREWRQEHVMQRTGAENRARGDDTHPGPDTKKGRPERIKHNRQGRQEKRGRHKH